MPVTRSAKKANRQAIRRRVKNLVQIKAYKGVINSFKKSPSVENLQKLFQILDKAAKNNLIHRNKASRLKSRLSKLVSAKR